MRVKKAVVLCVCVCLGLGLGLRLQRLEQPPELRPEIRGRGGRGLKDEPRNEETKREGFQKAKPKKGDSQIPILPHVPNLSPASSPFTLGAVRRAKADREASTSWGQGGSQLSAEAFD